MLPTCHGEFRCAADPQLRFAPSGVAVGNIRAVASSRKKNEAGEWVDDKLCWVTLTAFKNTAENMAESFEKGDLVTVVGKVQTDEWEDQSGNKRVSVNIIVESIGPSVAFDPARRVKQDGQQRQSRQTAPSPPEPENPWAGDDDSPPPF